MGPEQRDDMIWHHGEMLQGVPDTKMAMMSARRMVVEKARGEETAKMEELIRRQDEEGHLRHGSGPDEELFGKHRRKRFKDVYLCDVTADGRYSKHRWPGS